MAESPRKSAAKGQKKRSRRKQTKRLPSVQELLTVQQRQQVALRLLYGSDAVAYRVRGRKSLFREHMYEEGEKLAALGMTLEEIAAFWGVSYRTLQRWCVNKHDFRHTIKKAKDEADLQVEGSLYKRAKGYEYTEEHYELRVPQEGAAAGEQQPAPKMTMVRKVRKHIAADVTAAIFWLLNRQRERWKDRRALEIAPDTKLPLEIIISDGDATRRIGAASKDEEGKALPAPRESAAKP